MLRFIFPVLLLLLSGCEQLKLGSNTSNALGNRPDLDCLIANDFYAVHFSSYVQPTAEELRANPKASFVPFCQQIPRTGKLFFTADLIDRDIRTTPIGIKLVEIEKTGQPKPNDTRELRTLVEIAPKLFPRGAVEAQAEVNQKGDYRLYLMIGEALEEDDQFKIDLQVGVEPKGDLTPYLIAGAAINLILLVVVVQLWRRRKALTEPAS